MRNRVILKAPVLTTPLIIIAINAVVISFLFSVNDVNIPIRAGVSWAFLRLYEFPVFKKSVHYIGNAFGISHRPQNREFIPSAVTSDIVDALLSKSTGLPVFTPDQLALFDGSRPSKPIYLAILGQVYNVQKGKKHYAPGGGYHFFSGKDATRAFITGDFTEAGLIDTIDDLSEQELLSILDWIKFYDKDYTVVGVVEGTYYDAEGEPTPKLLQIKGKLAKAVLWQEKQLKETEVFPPCNSEWHKDQGGRVWCTSKSGGVLREWVGVPRRLFHPASKAYRCACVKNYGTPLATPNEDGNRGDLDNPNIKEYADCSPTSNSCKILADD